MSLIKKIFVLFFCAFFISASFATTTPTAQIITHNTIIDVPGSSHSPAVCPNMRFKTIQDVFNNCLANKIITPTATVTIWLTQSIESQKTIYINHPNSDRIIISSSPNSIKTLAFPTNQSGIVVQRGHALGGLNNIDLIGNGGRVPDSTSQTIGIAVEDNSTLQLGQNVSVNGFAKGLFANRNSSIFGGGNKNYFQFNKVAIDAENNATIQLADMSIAFNSLGVLVKDHSLIQLDGKTTIGVNLNGANIINHSTLRLSKQTEFVNNALTASKNSLLDIEGISTEGINENINILTGSILDANNATIKDTTINLADNSIACLYNAKFIGYYRNDKKIIMNNQGTYIEKDPLLCPVE